MGIGPRIIRLGDWMGNGNITRMIQYRGTGGRSARDWVQVVLVTGWPKEETGDGEVGTDINCI